MSSASVSSSTLSSVSLHSSVPGSLSTYPHSPAAICNRTFYRKLFVYNTVVLRNGGNDNATWGVLARSIDFTRQGQIAVRDAVQSAR